MFFNCSLIAQNCDTECENQIVNPDLEETLNGISDLRLAFELNYINGWSPSINSPHLFYQDANDVCIEDNAYNPNAGLSLLNCLTSFGGQSLIYVEGIKTDINFIQDEFITYCVSLNARQVDCTNDGIVFGGSTVYIRAANNIGWVNSFNLNFTNGGYPNVPGTDFEPIVEDFVLDANDVTIANGSYSPTEDYSQLEIFTIREDVSPNQGITSITNLNNINVQCETSALSAITSNINGSIGVFNGINLSDTDFASYHWDFGDGNSSTNMVGTNNYAAIGIYTVCLTIVDEYGCCATICINIEIDEITEACACEDAPSNAIQLIGSNENSDQLSELIDQGFFGNSTNLVNKDVLVCGTFYLDHDFFFTNCNFYFAPGSEFIVGEQGTVRLINSNLQGCGMMWKGITVVETEPLKYFLFSGNYIRDAYHALSIMGESSLRQQSNTFDMNYVGVYSPATGFVKSHAGGPVRDSRFICTQQLLPPYPGQNEWSEISYAGVHVNDLSQLILQDWSPPPFGLTKRNEFIGLRNGILSYNTNIVARGGIFENMIGSNYSAGISASMSGFGIATQNTTVVDIQNNRFNGGFAGIQVLKAISPIINIVGNDFDMLLNEDHFFAPISIYKTSGGEIKVNQNNIILGPSEFSTVDASPAIAFSTCFGLNLLEINNNVITSSLSNCGAISCQSVKFNITDEIESHGFIENNDVLISDTQVSPLSAGYLNFGNCNYLSVENNEIEINITGSKQAIGISNTTFSHFRSNRVTANQSAQSGFEIANSPGNLYCCNELINSGTNADPTIGVRFSGQNFPSTVSLTTSENHTFGLILGEAIIGQQYARGNKFLSNSQTRAAIFSSDPIASANNSPFFINFSEGSTLPDIVTPTIIELIWFKNDPNIGPIICSTDQICGIPPYELNPSNEENFANIYNSLSENIIPGVFVEYGNIVLGKYYLELLNFYFGEAWMLDEDLNEYFENSSSRSYYELLRLLESENLTSENLELYESSKTLYVKLLQVSDYFGTMNDQDFEVPYNEELIGLLELFSSAIPVNVELHENFRTNKKINNENVLEMLGKGNFSNDFEFAVASFVAHSDNIEVDKSVLLDISSTCIITNGDAIQLANSILCIQDPSHSPILNVDCIDFSSEADEVELRKNSKNVTELLVHPNPTTQGEFTISLEHEELLYGDVFIYSVKGELVFYRKLKKGFSSVKIDWTSHNGIYFVKYIAKDGTISMKKIVITAK